jgi:hypothetical protein
MRLNIIVAGLAGIAVGALVATVHARRKGLR